MNTSDLSIRAVGPSADDGTLSLAELARIAGGIQAALDRIAIAMGGRTVGPGPRSAERVGAVQLAIAGLRKGSVTLAVIPTGQATIDGDHILDDALDTLGLGVHRIVHDPANLPEHFTTPLINGLRDLAGGIGPGKLHRIDLLCGPRVIVSIDERFRRAVRDLVVEPATEPATVVGRLHMGDFSPAYLRCRIDTYAGSILCDFDVDLKDAVLNAMDQMVMASGMAQLQPGGSTIRTLHLTELDTLPSATYQSLEELAAAQGVGPIESIDQLVPPEIPDDELDAFLDAIGRGRGSDT